MSLYRHLRSAAIAFGAFAYVAACSPATPLADGPRTVQERSASDQRIGDETHPKILAQFGGEVENEGLKDYIRKIGEKLVKESEQPKAKWTFTVLDSPVVNAFALPGGYVYVTRGLIALANDEAELASVIGHEMGHVTGEHGAQRQERATIAQLGVLGATIAGALFGLEGDSLRVINQLGNTVGQGYVASYSRGQELEADELGVRYIARAGYDPLAGADFLASLQETTRLQSRLAGQGYDPNRVDFFATHPATAERVREAIAKADDAEVRKQMGAPRKRARFLREIDGMIYGDGPRQGYVRDRTFAHPELRISFEVPAGFTIQNQPQRVTAIGPDGAGIIFDADRDGGMRPDRYIADVWAAGIAKQTRTGRLENLRRGEIDGQPAASAEMAVETQQGVKIARMTAIKVDGRMYRFLGLQPQGDTRIGQRMDTAAESFRRLSKAEADALKPLRIAVREVRAGQGVADFAKDLPLKKFRRDRFRVLNGLKKGDDLRPGDLVKTVVEE